VLAGNDGSSWVECDEIFRRATCDVVSDVEQQSQSTVGIKEVADLSERIIASLEVSESPDGTVGVGNNCLKARGLLLFCESVRS